MCTCRSGRSALALRGAWQAESRPQHAKAWKFNQIQGCSALKRRHVHCNWLFTLRRSAGADEPNGLLAIGNGQDASGGVGLPGLEYLERPQDEVIVTSTQYIDAWFVNVGHGDCTIVRFPSGRVMMVDICNSKTLDKTTRQELYERAGMGTLDYLMWQAGKGASPSMEIQEYVKQYEAMLDCPIDVLKKKLPGESIWRFVLTHPDADHMEGFYRLFNQERSTIGVTCLWDTPHTKPTPEHKSTQSEQDWKEYQRVRGGLPDGPKVLNVFRDSEGEYWTIDGIRVLAPTKESVVASCNAECWNDLSYVLRITFGQSSLVLCGDAEVEALDKLAVDDKGKLKASVLKASHHGRDSGFSAAFVKECSPAYTIVSVGKAPETDATSKYKPLSGKVVSTRDHGTIHVRLWADGTVQAFDRNGTSLTAVKSTLSGRAVNI